VILIRFYEVLDQFGDLLECSGKDGLTEEIFPKDVKQGGTDVTNGVPAQPDRVYQIESEKHKPFKGKEYVQAIQIFGCPVRYNEFAFTRDGVTASELTEQRYNEELERLKKKKASMTLRRPGAMDGAWQGRTRYASSA
jgi:hypothetical protein